MHGNPHTHTCTQPNTNACKSTKARMWVNLKYLRSKRKGDSESVRACMCARMNGYYTLRPIQEMQGKVRHCITINTAKSASFRV